MACPLLAEAHAWVEQTLVSAVWLKDWTAAPAAFALVAAAEFGDKSQLVCMTLAARHRHWPVLLGAVLAFAILNAIAVLSGAAAARWLPEWAVASVVALMFVFFGLRALRAGEEEDVEVEEKTGHGIFLTAFAMIFLAEFGDKTQIAVAGLGAAQPPWPVWLGATLALAFTSAVGVWAGQWAVGKISQTWIHRIAGVLFLVFAAVAAGRVILPLIPADQTIF